MKAKPSKSFPVSPPFYLFFFYSFFPISHSLCLTWSLSLTKRDHSKQQGVKNSLEKTAMMDASNKQGSIRVLYIAFSFELFSTVSHFFFSNSFLYHFFFFSILPLTSSFLQQICAQFRVPKLFLLNGEKCLHGKDLNFTMIQRLPYNHCHHCQIFPLHPFLHLVHSPQIKSMYYLLEIK